MSESTLERSPVDAWVAAGLGMGGAAPTPEAVEAWQMAALRESLCFAAAHSAHWRQRLAGVDVDGLTRYASLGALPTMGEADLAGRENDFLCVPQPEVARLVSLPTTGTTGRPKRVAFAREDIAHTLGFMQAGLATFAKPGGRMLVLMSGEAGGGVGASVKAAMERHGVETRVYGGVENVADAHRALLEFRPQYLVANPYQMAALSCYGALRGSPEADFITGVLLSSDDACERVVQRVERLWQCDVYDHYGSTEMGFAAGVQCAAKAGYHLRDLDLLFEIIEPDETGLGEIAFSTLRRRAMPLVRYKTGDVGRITTAPCPCGSALRRIETVDGRRRNFFRLGGRRVSIADVANAVYADAAVADFDCALTGAPEADGLRLSLRYFAAGGMPDAAAVKERLALPGLCVTCEPMGAFSKNAAKKTVRRL